MSAIDQIQSSFTTSGGGVTPIALIASAAATSFTGGTITSTTGAIDTTGATLLVMTTAQLDLGGGPVVAGMITDSKGNTWTALTNRTDGGTHMQRLFYVANPVVGSGHTFTLNTVIASYNAIAVAAFSHVITTSPFDQENGAGNASATTQATGSVTPGENNELLVTGLSFLDAAQIGSATIDGGFTVAQSFIDNDQTFAIALAYLVQTTAGASNPTWTSPTSTGPMVAAIATFKHS